MPKKLDGFGKRLKEARALKGFSQQELGEKLLVKRNTISNYENENSFPDLDLLYKIVKILEVSSDYLLGLSELSINGNPKGNLIGNPNSINTTSLSKNNVYPDVYPNTVSEPPLEYNYHQDSNKEIEALRAKVKEQEIELKALYRAFRELGKRDQEGGEESSPKTA